MKSLIIVGNAQLEKDHSKFIDSCDCVVRFNNCKNYQKNSGGKTDLLFLNNTGNIKRHATLAFFLKKRNSSQIKIDLPYIKGVKSFIFVRPAADTFKTFLLNELPANNKLRENEIDCIALNGNIDISNEIVKALSLPIERLQYLLPDFHLQTWHKLKNLGSIGDTVLPSTGILGIEAILQNKEFKNYKKYIIGFTWESWNGHPMALEKKLVQNYINNKILNSVAF